ncbi:MAG: hypothetical protein ACRDO7_09125 [Nocardioidaceae bacterium]
MSKDSLKIYYHRGSGFALPAPRTWRMQEDPQDKVAVAMVAPPNGDDFRPNLVVTVDDLEPAQTLEPWQEFVESKMAEVLDCYMLLDTELLENGGFPVFRRLGHHLNADGVALTMQQWATVRGSRGYTLTTTASTMEVLRTAALFGVIAKGFSTDEDTSGADR